MLNKKKCAIIGTGFVGASIAFCLLKSELFSEIVLIDQNQEKAMGEAMDLNHGMPFCGPVKLYAGNYSDLGDAGIVIITAGANQAPGETRMDLIGKNTKIFQSIIPSITEVNKDCILLIVANPVDVLTYVALKLSNFPPNRVIGSGTVLDTARLKSMLGDHLSIDPRDVSAFIIGEHGDSELPVWSSSTVSGLPIDQFCTRCGRCKNSESLRSIFQDVKDSAYKVIEAKGATYYAIALAVERIVTSIVRNEKSILTVSSLIDGPYGLHNVCLGLPTVVDETGINAVLDIPLSQEESAALHKSAETLQEALSSLHL